MEGCAVSQSLRDVSVQHHRGMIRRRHIRAELVRRLLCGTRGWGGGQRRGRGAELGMARGGVCLVRLRELLRLLKVQQGLSLLLEEMW